MSPEDPRPNPAPSPMRAPLWALAVSTVVGVLVLSATTTLWSPHIDSVALASIPVAVTVFAGLFWATFAGARGPLHVLLPVAIVAVLLLLTQGDGLVPLILGDGDPAAGPHLGAGAFYGPTGLLFVALATLAATAGAMVVARTLGHRAQSLELSRSAAIRRSARSTQQGDPGVLEEQGRTPPPTRIFAHVGTAIAGVAFAYVAMWWFGSAFEISATGSTPGFAVPASAVVLLLVTGAIVLLGALSSWAPAMAGLATFLIPPIVVEGGMEGLPGAMEILIAVSLGYHLVMLPVFAFATELVRSARASGHDAASRPLA